MDANQRIRQLENELRQIREGYSRRGQHLSALGQDVNAGSVIKEFYTYQEDYTAVAAGASATGNINIQADSDFVLQKLTYAADVAGSDQTDSTRVVPLITIQITDTGSGRNLMESGVPVTAMFGTGELPFILPTPRLFLARSTITATIANYSNATTYNLRLSFIGYKVYRGLTG